MVNGEIASVCCRHPDLVDAARVVPRHGAVLARRRVAGASPPDPPDAPLDRRARPAADRAWRAPGGGGPRADGAARLQARPGRPAGRARSLEDVDSTHDRRSPERAGVPGRPAHGGVGAVALPHTLQRPGDAEAAIGSRAALGGRAGRRSMSVTRTSLTMLIATLSIAGCAKTPIVASAAVPAPSAASRALPAPSGSVPASLAEARTPAEGSRAGTVAGRPPLSEFRTIDALKDIYFDFDRYDIRTDAAKVLDADAAWLNDNARTLVLIEGHADERGTNEYNLVLGERRAKTTLDYLVSHGVQGSRITVISYGEEGPVCKERTEACWAKNRRAHFLVKAE